MPVHCSIVCVRACVICAVAVKLISSALLKTSDRMAIKYLSSVCKACVSVCVNFSHPLKLSSQFPIYDLSVGVSNLLPSLFLSFCLSCTVTVCCHCFADEGNMLSVLDGCFWKFEERQMVEKGDALTASSRRAFLTSPVSFAF